MRVIRKLNEISADIEGHGMSESGPRLKSVGLRIREPETWSVARISTSAKPSAGDVFLADGMVRKRPNSEMPGQVIIRGSENE